MEHSSSFCPCSVRLQTRDCQQTHSSRTPRLPSPSRSSAPAELTEQAPFPAMSDSAQSDLRLEPVSPSPPAVLTNASLLQLCLGEDFSHVIFPRAAPFDIGVSVKSLQFLSRPSQTTAPRESVPSFSSSPLTLHGKLTSSVLPILYLRWKISPVGAGL